MKRICLLAALVASPLIAQTPPGEPLLPPLEEIEQPGATVPAEWLKALSWRSIGPASMGGRIVDIEVVESNPYVFYVASASGGLFKTTNNGTTFTPLFDKQATVSIGDVAVSRSHPETIWVGAGEHNARNSVSWGNGVYKSLDGGKSWRHMGLDKIFQTGRIAIHPTDPNIVYVGALGRLWGPNPERGLYKTTDGGKTWSKVLHVDDHTGCVEVAMHPTEPDTLIVAMYQRQRDAFDGHNPAVRWGPGSGIYKTTDGGRKWQRLTEGLPEAQLGRVGIQYFRGNPEIVYAIVETEKIGAGAASAYFGIQTVGSSREPGTAITVVPRGPAAKAGLETGDKILAIDDKQVKTQNAMIVEIRKHRVGQKSTIKYQRGEEQQTAEITWGARPGQSGSQRPFTAYLGGQRANAQQAQGKIGNETGGIYRSQDGGETWARINSLNPRPFYYSQIRIDPSDEKYQYVMGVRLHASSNGGAEYKSIGNRVHPDHHALWIDPHDGRHLILGCDGGLYVSYDRGATWDFHNIMAIGQFYDVGVDMRRPYWAYGGLQDNGSWGAPTRKRGSTGPTNDDWLRIGGGDGFVCRVDPNDSNLVYYEMQGGKISRLDRATGARARIAPLPVEGLKFEFNWKTPFTLSRHNSKIFYCAGNYVFRSLDRGSRLRVISPRIGRTERGTATAISESPLDPDVVYVGADDGALWVTRDSGGKWDEISGRVGLPGHFHVSSIEASRFEAGRAYVAFDGHRSDNDDPHVCVTEDYGQTWQSINGNLPTGSTRVLREDAVNSELLLAGTEFGVFASVDRGGKWTRVNNNLPTVAVHELAIHPREHEVVAATHGRSMWVLDITPLRQHQRLLAQSPAHLFKPSSSVLWAGALGASRFGNRVYAGQNAAFGCPLHYWLSKPAKPLTLEIRGVEGEPLRRLKITNKPGLHRAQWDLRGAKPRTPGELRGIFKRMDQDESGTLTDDDAKGGFTNVVKLAIRAADADKDGGVTEDELLKAKLPPQLAYAPARPVAPGEYLAVLKVGDKQYTQTLRVEADPEAPAGLLEEELKQFEAKQRASFVE